MPAAWAVRRGGLGKLGQADASPLGPCRPAMMMSPRLDARAMGYVQHSADLALSTDGEVQIIDLSDRLADQVARSGVATGQALLFTVSSTSAITGIEHEPGLLHDLPAALDRLFPRHGEGVDYGHEEAWHDGNGHSHIRASFLKPDLVLPVRDGKPLLGTWQQVVFVELDNKARRRSLAVHVWGSDD